MRILRSIGLFLLVVSSLSGCKGDDSASEPVIRPVRILQIREAGAQTKQTLAGVTRSSQEMSLSFRVPGTLTELTVKLGDTVEKGDLIARVDDKDAQIDVERARASVARANAEHRSALADFERTKLLYADGSASRADLDAARALEESKRAMLAAENKGLELARSQLTDHVLKAPLPGAIADVPVEVNENVQSGQVVALLNAGEKAEVEVAVPEGMIQFFHRGSPATVTFDTIQGESFEGIVSEVGVASSSGSAGFPVRVALLKADSRVRAGMSALVTLALGEEGGDVKIFAPPAGLLEGNDKKRYVMLAMPTEDGFAKVERRDVEIGEPTSLGVLITSGLKGGERVIVAGLSSITEGMKVRLLTRSEPAGAEERINQAIPREMDGSAEQVVLPVKKAEEKKAPGAEKKGADK